MSKQTIVRTVGWLGLAALLYLVTGFREPPNLGPRTATLLEGDDETLEEKVRELLELSGASKVGQQTMEQMMEQFEKMPLPDGFAELFLELADPDEIVEMTIGVYMKHLDEATVDAAIVWAKSPGGQKFNEAQPAIMKESLEIGMQWGQELAQEVMEKLGR